MIWRLFFPQSDRLKFALKINTIIASPSFNSWLEGESLDISKMLYSQSGKAKVNIFSIAHLNDSQRMFFVTILLNQMFSLDEKTRGNYLFKSPTLYGRDFWIFSSSMQILHQNNQC